MTSGSPSDGDPRVIDFRTRRANAARAGAKATGRGGDDLAPYARTPDDPAEYRHRMMVNGAALLFVVALIGVAIWLADTMAEMRRNQDCVLSGRRGCTAVEYERRRWSAPAERPPAGTEAPPPRQP